jgi:phage shock protein PspC (stress-responsive transcriptional regulator)
MALKRDLNDRVLGGVCSGLAQWEYFDCKPGAFRLAFVVAFLLLGGAPACAVYALLWIFLPTKETQ